MNEKLIRVELWYEREDGSHVMKRAERAEAEKWNAMNIQVASFAQAHNANPDWSTVEWETAEFPARKKHAATQLEQGGRITDVD